MPPSGAGSSSIFERGVEAGEPLLIVAPMSGHYATLLCGTVARMLPKHDVFITDWRDASSCQSAKAVSTRRLHRLSH
jgi:poly-beta-hydroxyalkanoate depolymerase